MEIDNRVDITIRNNKYYRLYNNQEIEVNENGDCYIKVANDLINSETPIEYKKFLSQIFGINPIIFKDCFKNIWKFDDYVIIQTGIFREMGFRYTKTSNFEFNLSLNTFGVQNIVDDSFLKDFEREIE